MAAYLESRGAEVLNMLLTEWNMEDALRVAREEEREIGFAEGEKIGEKRGEKRAAYSYATRMKSAGLDIKLIVECTGLTLKEVEKL
jgi:predicted transposase YdaD